MNRIRQDIDYDFSSILNDALNSFWSISLLSVGKNSSYNIRASRLFCRNLANTKPPNKILRRVSFFRSSILAFLRSAFSASRSFFLAVIALACKVSTSFCNCSIDLAITHTYCHKNDSQNTSEKNPIQGRIWESKHRVLLQSLRGQFLSFFRKDIARKIARVRECVNVSFCLCQRAGYKQIKSEFERGATLSDYPNEGNRKVGLVPVYAITKRHPAMQTACLLMEILKRVETTALSLSASRLGRNENAHCRLADCISAPIKNFSNLYWGDSALAESRLTSLFFLLKKQARAKSLRMAHLLKWLAKVTQKNQLTRLNPKTENSVLQPCTDWVEVVCSQSTLKGF